MEEVRSPIRKVPFIKQAAWLEWVLVLILFALGVGLRLIDLTDQPLDFHPTRQLRAAIIARGMYYQTLPDLDPAVREPALTAWNSMERYEPPIFEALVAFTYRLMGAEHLWVARIYAILFWTVGGAALYGLARRLVSPLGAVFSLAFYLVLPWGVVASRSFQPDPFMVMWILLAALAIERWLAAQGRSWLWTVLAGLFSGAAVLVKAVAVYPVGAMLVGAGLFLVIQDRSVLRRPQIWLMAVLSASLPAIYYLGLGARSSEFASFWIFSFTSMVLDSKFYVRWLGLIRGLMDVMIFFAAILGAFLFNARGRVVVLGLWVGYLLTGLTFPFQIYTHDYYSLMLVPLAALSLAPMVDAVVQAAFSQSWLWKLGFVLASLGIMGYYAYVGRSILLADNYRNEPIPWQRMSQELPRDGNIIALTHDYGNRLKYYSLLMPHRLWPSGSDLDLASAAGTDKIGDFDSYFQQQTEGMDYFLVTLFGDLNAQTALKARLNDHYPVAAQGDGYIVYDLRHPH